MPDILFDKAKWSQDSEGFWLSLKVKTPAIAKDFVTNIKNCFYSANLKEYRQRRSLDANAYFWILCGKLSATLKIPSVELYRQYIKDIGDNFQILPIRDDAKDKWTKMWGNHGIGWVCDDLGMGKIEGYSNIICYYGSSEYDTTQMARLIYLIVQDCKDQNVETMSPQELNALTSRWER